MSATNYFRVHCEVFLFDDASPEETARAFARAEIAAHGRFKALSEARQAMFGPQSLIVAWTRPVLPGAWRHVNLVYRGVEKAS